MANLPVQIERARSFHLLELNIGSTSLLDPKILLIDLHALLTSLDIIHLSLANRINRTDLLMGVSRSCPLVVFCHLVDVRRDVLRDAMQTLG